MLCCVVIPLLLYREAPSQSNALAVRVQGDESLASVELMSLPQTLIIPASQLQLKDTLGQGRYEHLLYEIADPAEGLTGQLKRCLRS